MCGICGHTADPDRSAVDAMNAAMVHRGPDDGGSRADRGTGVALGARRLAIIDVEGGHQPLANEDGSVWAVLNGEIYNHRRLQELVRERGHRLATATDTEVLVHLYEDHGDDLVHALEGMFAFAIWDERAQRLTVARDRFGEKPLYWAQEDGRLVFASELGALLAGLQRTPELDAASLDHFFVHGYFAGEQTIMRGVRQLLPGHRLSWDNAVGSIEVSRYWRPPPATAGVDTGFGELKAETRRILESSVRSRMIADVPLGVFLSGGVDSTLVAAVAAAASTRPIKTFTVVYDVGDVSETRGSRLSAERLGSEHHELLLSSEDVAAGVPALLASLDQPLADPSIAAFHALAGFARSEVTVAVGGEGADELFGGYPRYRWLGRAARLDAVPAPLARIGARAARRIGARGRAKRLADVLEPAPALERHLDWVTDGRRGLRERFYGPGMPVRAEPEGLLPGLDGSLGAGSVRDFMRLDQLQWLPGDVLAKADRASMLVSLEVRTPFLHHELAELAASIPAQLHVGGRGKTLLRAVLDDVIESDEARPKTAFRVPMAEWLRGPLAPAMREQLATGALFEEGLFDRGAATTAFADHVDGRADSSGVLWHLLCFGLWLDRHRGRDGG